MKVKSYSLMIYLLGISTLLISCSNSGAQNPQQARQPQPYPVLELQPRSITLTTGYPATLKGIQTVEIRPRVAGYITAIPVDEGAIVEKGEVLFRLNNEEYKQQIRTAKANIQAAKAQVNSAENEVHRLQPLAKKGIVSEYRLESARYNLQSAKAALAQAQAALENAKINMSYTVVKSPTDGVIGSIPYRIGSLVSSSITQPLTIVSDISKMFAYFSMSERELLEMALAVAGEGGNKTLQQLIKEMPDVSFVMANNKLYGHKGNLELASGLINTRTGSAYFRAVFPNPQQILRTGGTGNVLIPIHVDSAIVIPKSATYEIQKKRFVYILTDSGTAESVEIQTLPQSTERLFVITSGLNAGSTIITAGLSTLQDDARIKPNPVNADSLYQALN
ncbi:MAG TPA: efflux RND transporter periplasmic adaptor subunit [Balneolaceae bacterium]